MPKAAALDADEAVPAGSVFRTVFDEQRRMRIAVQVDGDAKIRQLDDAILGGEDVGALDVAVDVEL